MLLISYAENYSLRFQDEFGFNDPIVREFQRRTKVDLRTQPFTRQRQPLRLVRPARRISRRSTCASSKDELRRDGKKLGMFVNPQQPHFTQPWNVPELMLTAGHIYCDLETWVRDGIVDHLMVYGSCDPRAQNRDVDDCLWMTRATPSTIGALTSSPFAERWKPYADQGVLITTSLGEDASYLDRSQIPEQPLAVLASLDPVLRMRVLAQIIYGKTPAPAGQVAAVADDPNPLVRRMALAALGKLKDPASVPLIEAGLEDPENCVRCAGGPGACAATIVWRAQRRCWRPSSGSAIIRSRRWSSKRCP